MKFVFVAVAVLLVAGMQANCANFEANKIGDTSGEARYQMRFEKNGVPLFTRCSEFTYPLDLVSDYS